jgi:hypothetical protein
MLGSLSRIKVEFVTNSKHLRPSGATRRGKERQFLGQLREGLNLDPQLAGLKSQGRGSIILNWGDCP